MQHEDAELYPVRLHHDALLGVLSRLALSWDETAPPVQRLRALREAVRDLTGQHLILFEATLPVSGGEKRDRDVGFISRSQGDEDSPHGALLQILARLRRAEQALIPSAPEPTGGFVPDAETAGAMLLGQITSQFGPAMQDLFRGQAQMYALRAVAAARDAGMEDLAEQLAARIRAAASASAQ